MWAGCRRRVTREGLSGGVQVKDQQRATTQSRPARNDGRIDPDRAPPGPQKTASDEAARIAFEEIKKSCTLPTPDGVVLEILHLTGDSEATIGAITTAVESDPAMASRLLKYVNTPRAGVSHTVTSVRSAITLLGMKTVRSIALGFSLVSKGTRACKGFEGNAFWSESLARASACHLIADKCHGLTPDELFTCALLSQVGRLAFASVFPQTYAEVLYSVDTSDFQALANTEREAFEIDHAALSAEMMTEWGLPTLFTDAVRAQLVSETPEETESSSDRLANALRFAAPLSILLTRRRVRRDTLRRMVLSATHAGITPDDVSDVFDLIARNWMRMSGVFSLPTRRVPVLAELYVQAH